MVGFGFKKKAKIEEPKIDEVEESEEIEEDNLDQDDEIDEDLKDDSEEEPEEQEPEIVEKPIVKPKVKQAIKPSIPVKTEPKVTMEEIVAAMENIGKYIENHNLRITNLEAFGFRLKSA